MKNTTAVAADRKALKYYRNAIRHAWLPLVGRKKLSSFEYVMIEEWWNDNVPVAQILEAIKQVKQRVLDHGGTLYSLGIVKGDLAGIRARKAKLYVGGGIDCLKKDQEWRERTIEDLTEIADLLEAEDPERAAMYRGLLRDLPKIQSKEEFEKRWKEISQER